MDHEYVFLLPMRIRDSHAARAADGFIITDKQVY